MATEEVIAALCDIFGSLDIEPNFSTEDLMLAVDNTKYASTFGPPAFDSISSFPRPYLGIRNLLHHLRKLR